MPAAVKSLKSRSSKIASASVQVRLLEETRTIDSFDVRLQESGHFPLTATGITVFQVNVGKLCNQTCGHCHVDAGPDRTEVMSRRTAEACMAALSRTDIPNVDITGGAPELNPNFRFLVTESRRLGRHVMDRCNLTVLLLQSQPDLAEFLAEHEVEVIASLPYYAPAQTDAQRGFGVFGRSIQALRKLNTLGYGNPGSGLLLNLVSNPVGAFLPPSQKSMEALFRRKLDKDHEVTFNKLYTITNMPISRFLDFLIASGNYEEYMQRLAQSFNPGVVDGVMCRYTLSVGWDGVLYDCDFNQMLELPIVDGAPSRPSIPPNINEFNLETLNFRRIITGNHCYGCTAGAGSSCGGETA